MYLETYKRIESLINDLVKSLIHNNKAETNKLLDNLGMAAIDSKADYKNFITMLDSVSNLLETDIKKIDYCSQTNIEGIDIYSQTNIEGIDIYSQTNIEDIFWPTEISIGWHLIEKIGLYLTIVNNLIALSAEEDSLYKENATDKERKTSLENYSDAIRTISAAIALFVQSTEKSLGIVINKNLDYNIADLNCKMIKSVSEHSANYLNDLSRLKYKVGDCGIPNFDYKSFLLDEAINALHCKADTIDRIEEEKSKETTALENCPSQVLDRLDKAALTIFFQLLSLGLPPKENHPNLFAKSLPETSLEALNIEEHKKETEQKKEVSAKPASAQQQ